MRNIDANSKFEARNSKQIRISKFKTSLFQSFEFWSFVLVSDLDIRISDLEFVILGVYNV
jgi:hypothetical protein